MNALNFIKKHCNCCISGQPLKTSRFINVMQLHYKAEWKYPVWGNIDTATIKGMAVAYFHDDCYIDGKVVGEVRFAIEQDGNNIVYHPLSKLMKVDFSKEQSASLLPIPGISELIKISNYN